MSNSVNRFSQDVELELQATRVLLEITRNKLAAAIYSITELETLLEMTKPDAASSGSEESPEEKLKD